MFSFAAILILGFFLGMRHATDPDHVIAVTTIVSPQRGIAKAGLIGIVWGLGHTFSIFVAGTLIILLQVSVPPHLGLSMELAVGIMMILLGVLNLTGVLRQLQERFMPQNQTPNASGSSWLDRAMPGVGYFNALRPLIVGIVHGLAGSAAVALLVMTTIHNPWWAIAYLLIFGVGTVAGMMLITAVIAMPFAYTARRFSGWKRMMAFVPGLLSLSFGLFLFYQISIMDGLFTSHPRWTPH